MKMRVTAPCEVDGVPHSVGDVVDVTQAGEVNRLTHYGQAVPVSDGTDTTKKAVKATTKAKASRAKASTNKEK